MRISDLEAPVTAAKSYMAPSGASLNFTPADDSTNARAACEVAVSHQVNNGYVLDYVTRGIDKPNPGYENDSEYLEDLRQHNATAGRLVAVHRLRPGGARSLRKIIGDAEYERIQDMWAREGNRCRWSVAFPIVETFEIIDPPDAKDVLGVAGYQRLFQHSAKLLRPLTEEDRRRLANLEIRERPAVNVWIAIDDEAEMAAGSQIPENIDREIQRDLNSSAMEGLTEEQRQKVRSRAAWLADRFVRQRRQAGTLHCDDCRFDPAERVAGTGINPRSLLDVHHRDPLAEGTRYTRPNDFTLLCPTCHRYHHALMRVNAARD